MPTSIAEAAARHCGRLRRLRVEEAESDGTDILPLLRVVSCGLTELAIVAPSHPASIPGLEVVKDFCAQLRRLEVWFKYGGGSSDHVIINQADCNGTIPLRSHSSPACARFRWWKRSWPHGRNFVSMSRRWAM